jgi:hypothetical protein
MAFVLLATDAILNQPMAFTLASLGVIILLFTFSGVVAKRPPLFI